MTREYFSSNSITLFVRSEVAGMLYTVGPVRKQHAVEVERRKRHDFYVQRKRNINAWLRIAAILTGKEKGSKTCFRA